MKWCNLNMETKQFLWVCTKGQPNEYHFLINSAWKYTTIHEINKIWINWKINLFTIAKPPHALHGIEWFSYYLLICARLWMDRRKHVPWINSVFCRQHTFAQLSYCHIWWHICQQKPKEHAFTSYTHIHTYAVTERLLFLYRTHTPSICRRRRAATAGVKC